MEEIKYGKLFLTVKHPFLEHKKVEVLANNEGTEYTCKFYDQSEILDSIAKLLLG